MVKRKNFFPTLLITVFLWLSLAAIIYFIEPDTFGILPLFFINIFFALLFTFSTIFGHSRRGFIAATCVTLFTLLRYFGIGNVINLLLIAGAGISIEIYFSKTNPQ